MKLKFLLIAVVACLVFQNANAKTFYVSEALGNDTFDGSSPVMVTDTIGPFKTIIHALDSANNGDTIRVAEGFYVGNLLIDKQITVYGPNRTFSGRLPRGPEAIILPDTSQRGMAPENANTLITILSDSVTFDGFLLIGDNDTINSSNPLWGGDPDVSYGIVALGKKNMIRMNNNRIVGFDEGGVLFDGENMAGSADNKLTGTYVMGVGAIGLRGRGIWIRNSGHLVVEDCQIDSAEYGVAIENITDSLTKGIAVLGSGTLTSYGLYVDGQIGQNASVLLLASTISAFTPNSGNGITVSNSAAGVEILSQANNIMNFVNGISISNLDQTKYQSIGDTISQVTYGIRISNTLNAVDTLFINGSSLSGVSEDAVFASCDSSRTVVTAKDLKITNSGNGFGLMGDIQLEPGNAALSSVTGYYVRSIASVEGKYPMENVNATNVSFEGKSGSAATVSENMLVESKILHYLDSSKFHFVNFHDNNLYIDHTDGNDSMMRAVNVASDNYTIHSSGSDYDEVVRIANDITLNSVSQDTIRILEMNGVSKTLTLTGRVNLRNGLALVNGIVTTSGSGEIYVGMDGVAEAPSGISGGSNSSYVEGILNVVNTSALNGDEMYFPIATAGHYRPVKMYIDHTTAGAVYTISGELMNAAATGNILSPDLTHLSYVHYWNFGLTGIAPISDIQYEALYATAPVSDEAPVPSHLRLAANTGTGWVNIGGNGSAPNNGTIRSDSNYLSISDITLANAKGQVNRLGRTGTIADFSWTMNCVSDSIRFTSQSTTTAGSISSYFWDFGDGAINSDTSDMQNPGYQYNQPGTYTVTHWTEDVNGSRDSITFDVTVDPIPVVGFTTDIPCAPNAIDFTDTSSVSSGNNVTWEWNIGGSTVFSQNVSAPLPDTGTYTIKLYVTTDMGCTDSASQTIFYGDSVQISITPAGPINKCEEDIIQLTATTNARDFQWVYNGSTSLQVSVQNPGFYVFEGRTSENCYGKDSVEIINVASPVADAGMDTAIFRGTSVILQGSGGGGYEWTPTESLDDPNAQNPKATPIETTVYVLRVFNAIGCDAFDSVTVTVNWPEKIVVPNLITPNNDGMNDVWDISGVPAYEDATIYILSRWGKQVYQSDKYKNDWNGVNADGDPLPEGTYTYIIVYNNSDLGTLKGNLQIIR